MNMMTPSREMLKDPSGFSIRWNHDQARAWRTSGQWEGLTVADRARHMAREHPHTVCHVSDHQQLTYSEVLHAATSLAVQLQRGGWQKGHVLAFMIPNWHEGVIIDVAAAMLGLVLCPIVPIYRDREVQSILQETGARGIFVPTTWRHFDYLSMVNRLQPALPALEDVWTVRGEGANDFKALVTHDAAGATFEPVSADSIKLIMYTSGTTGRAKGVLHTHNTIARVVTRKLEHWQTEPGQSVLAPSPITHVTGLINGLELPFFQTSTCFLMERWNAETAAHIIEKERISYTLCATPFMQELLDAAEHTGRDLSSLRMFPCGGAAVPPQLIRQFHMRLPSCRAFRVYGSSEAPLITQGFVDSNQAQLAAETDGAVVDYQVRIVDLQGFDVPNGMDGEICAKGPSLFVGYLNPEDNPASFDDQGFFRTGDLGHRTPEGAIVISGRIKDLINRGGEKISAKEIEDLLLQQPGLAEASVVAMPHPRLGETVCAYVRLRSGILLPESEILSALEATGIARQKLPEAIIFMQELPKTAAGKVRKEILREDARQRCQKGHLARP